MKAALILMCAATLASVAGGCSKKEDAPPTTTTTTGSAATTAATATPTAPATTAATAPAAAAPKTLAGTCTTKAGARILGCTEYYGKLPDKVEESCKKDEGTFVAGATPCTTTAAIGKCEPKDSSGPSSKTEVSYKTSVGDAKGSCEILGNTWTALAGAAAPADPKKKK